MATVFGVFWRTRELGRVPKCLILLLKVFLMISEALRLIRVFHDIKQSELSRKMGISNSYLSEIEKGKKQPSLDLIERYSTEFKIPVSSILFFSENLEQPENRQTRIDKARGVVAKKILNFLQLIEAKTELDAEEIY